MAFDKTNTVTVNKNDKQGNENWADLKLDINIDGVRYFGKVWKKDGFYSGPVEKADEKYQPNGGSSSSSDDGIDF